MPLDGWTRPLGPPYFDNAARAARGLCEPGAGQPALQVRISCYAGNVERRICINRPVADENRNAGCLCGFKHVGPAAHQDRCEHDRIHMGLDEVQNLLALSVDVIVGVGKHQRKTATPGLAFHVR